MGSAYRLRCLWALFLFCLWFHVIQLKGLILIGAFILAAGTTFITNWLALIPWRKTKGTHWSERARLLYPAVVAARWNLWSIPAVFTLAVVLLWPGASPPWLLTGTISLLGAYVGTSFLDHEVFARVSMRELLRLTVISLLVRYLSWFVFISAVVWMPSEFNLSAWTIGGSVIAFWMVWARYGWLWVGKKLGIYLPAPERLSKITAETSARMNISYREVLLMRSPFCQAYAVFSGRKLLFSERLLEISSDEEIAAICAHELAHLTESKAVRFSRYIKMLTYLPWMFFTPLLHAFGMIAFFGLILITVYVPRIYGSLSRKLESRADAMAKANEGDSGVYARALARIYEDNLTPAVTTKTNKTHPDLYDRLLAAGVTPDFPRPSPAVSSTWHGWVFSWLAGLLFGIFAIRFVQSL